MNKCPSCGHERNDRDMKCPQCGSFYSKIDEILAEQEAYEEMHSFRGRFKRIIKSDNVKREVLAELKLIKAGLSKKSLFTIYVIIAFVFALVISVL
ncbi:MAG: hypothetical protein PHF31_02335 [Methylobacter sp.]|nr:hypothetical protein [Methylobacter sp.]